MPTVQRPPVRTSPAWLRWLPFLAWVGFVAGLFGPGSAGFAWVGRQPWGDKLAHVLLIGTAAFLLDHALAGRRVRLWRNRAPLGGVVVAVLMTAEEVSQLWAPGRCFEWGDLAANYIGIAAAGLVSAWLSGRQTSQGQAARRERLDPNPGRLP